MSFVVVVYSRAVSFVSVVVSFYHSLFASRMPRISSRDHWKNHWPAGYRLRSLLTPPPSALRKRLISSLYSVELLGGRVKPSCIRDTQTSDTSRNTRTTRES